MRGAAARARPPLRRDNGDVRELIGDQGLAVLGNNLRAYRDTQHEVVAARASAVATGAATPFRRPETGSAEFCQL